MALTVAGDVVTAFTAALSGTLDSLQTLEASLQWLKKDTSVSVGGEIPVGVGGGGGGTKTGGDGGEILQQQPQGLKDSQRIGLQLALDTWGLGDELGGVGKRGVEEEGPSSLGHILGLVWDKSELTLSQSIQEKDTFSPLRLALLTSFSKALALARPYLPLVKK